MKKYNTKPIDFTGCHPVIAEALKRSEIVKCKVWDFGRDRGHEVEAWICRYNSNSDLPYISGSNTPWRNAEPIPVKVKIKRIMPPERAIPVLIAKGFTFTSTGYLAGPGIFLSPHMYALMGKPADEVTFTWPSCIIEEVEGDE